MILLFLLIPLLVIIPAYADSTEYQNTEFGYSMTIPSEWIVDDQPFTSTSGDFDKLISTAAIYDKEDWNHYIEISFIENDNLISNYSGEQYFHQVNSKLRDNCNEATLESDGYSCINYAVLGNKEITINGKEAYQIIHSWTEVYQNKVETEFVSIIIDIPMNNDAWNIEVYSVKEYHDENQNEIMNIINSFEITETQKIPDWVKNTMGWYLEGKISEDEMIRALQFLINENIILVN